MSDDAADDFVDAEKMLDLWHGKKRLVDTGELNPDGTPKLVVWSFDDPDGTRNIVTTEQLTKGARLAHAVLLFFDPSEWTADKRVQWKAITGNDECVSKVLGDMARELIREEAKP